MKTISIWACRIELNIDTELKVKHLRLLAPIQVKYKDSPIELIIEITKALSVDPKACEDTIDSMNQEQFEEFAKAITAIISNDEKKTNKS